MKRPVIGLWILACLSLSGCSEPLWQFPGKALGGPQQPLDLTKLSPEGGIMQLETNPTEPYSVNIGYVVIQGRMYIDPAESRTWYQNIKQNPKIRLRLDGAEAVHPATAVAETDPAIVRQFEEDRHVLRIMPALN